MYAKLKQGLSSQYLYYAPKSFTTPEGEVINNFDSNEEKLAENGFKLVIDLPPDVDKYSSIIIDSYIEDDDYIIIVYDTVNLNYDLESDVKNKISITKQNLEEYLNNNPLYSEAHGDGDYYTVTQEKQLNLISTYNTFKMLQGTEYEQPLLWNAKGKTSEVWTENELLQLISEVNSYVKPLIVLQQYLEEELKSCKCRKDVYKVILTINPTRAQRLIGNNLNI